MIKPIGFLNTDFQGNTWTPRFEKNKAENSKRVGSLNTINSNKGVNRSFNYSHLYTNNTDAKGNLKKLKKMKRIATEKGSIYSFDLETLGHVEDHKDIAAITDASIVKKRFLPNGEVVEETVSTIRPGIDPTKKKKYEVLLERAQTNFKSLSSAERSTVQRLAFESVEGGDIKATSRDIKKAREGLDKLVAEGEAFAKGHKTYGKALEHQMTQFSNTLNTVGKEKDSLLIGYNTNDYDIDFLNKYMDNLGMDTKIDGSHHLDILEPVKFGLTEDTFNIHKDIRSNTGVKGDVKSGYNKLETFTDSFGFKGVAHTAEDDSFSTIKTFTKPYKNEETILDLLIEKNENKVLTEQKEVNEMIIKDKIFGFKTSIEMEGYDYLYQNGEQVDYLSYGVNRQNFYQSEGMKFIPASELSDEILKAHKAEDGLYSMTFNNLASESDQSVTIFRKNKQDIFNQLQKKSNVFDKGEIAQADIDKVFKDYSLDKSRRRFEGFFDAGDRGFKDLKDVMEAYNEIKEMNPNITQEGVRALFNEGVDDSAFESLRHSSGDIIDSKVNTLIDTFNLIDESEHVLNPLVEEIDAIDISEPGKIEGEYLTPKENALKTQMVSDSFNEILEGQELTKDDLFYTNQEFNVNKIDKMDVVNSKKINDYKRIDLTNESSIQSGLYFSALNETDQTELKITNERRLKEALEVKAEDLIQRGLLDEQVLIDARTVDNQSAHYLSNVIANNVHNKHARVKEEIRRNGLNEDSAKQVDAFNQYHKKEVKVLANEMQGELDVNEKTVRDITNKNIDKVKAVTVSDYKANNLNDSLKETLKNDFGYSDKHVDTLDRILNDYKNNQFSTAVYEEDGILKLGFQYNDLNIDDGIEKKRSRTSKLYRDISSGNKPDDLFEVRLPKLIKNDTGEYIQLGGTEKLNTKKLSTYYGHKQKFVTKKIDIMEESINNLMLGKNTALRHLQEGRDPLKAQKALRRLVEGPLAEAPGHSAHKTLIRGEEMKRIPFANMKDYIVGKGQVDLRPLADFLPFVYDEAVKNGEKEFVASMDKAFGKGTFSAKQNFEYMKKQMRAPNSKFGHFENLSVSGQEFFIREMFTPEDVKGEIKKEGLIDRLTKAGIDKTFIDPEDIETIKMLEDLSRQGTFINKSKHTANAKALIDNPIDYIPMGFLSDQSRDVPIQSLSFDAIDLGREKFTDGFVKELKDEYDISFKRNMETYKSLDFMKKVDGKMAAGVMTNLEQTRSSEVLRRIDNLNAKEIAERTGIKEQKIKESIEKYKANADLYENSMLMNPALQEGVFDNKDLMSIKYDTDEGVEFIDNELAIGKKIKKGDVVGELRYQNGDVKEVLHKGEDGYLRNMEEGKLYVNPINAQTDATKIIINNDEKGMAVVADKSKAGQEVWNELFGKDTGIVARLEESKHASFNLRFGGELNKIIDTANELGDGEIEKLASRLNENKSLDFGASIDDGRLIIKGNPKGKGGYINELKTIVDEYKTNDKYKHNFDSDKNMLRVFMSKGQHSDIYSHQGDVEDIGKGVKLNDRLLDSIAMSVGDEGQYQELVNGKYRTVANPIIDDLIKRAQPEDFIKNGRITEFGMAKENAMNIRQVIKGAIDPESVIDDGIKVVNMDLETLGDIGGLKEVDELRNSVYKTNSKGRSITADVFNIDLGDIQVENPITKEMTSKVSIPFLHSHVINNKVIDGKAQKATSNFIKEVNELKAGDNVGNLGEKQGRVNKAYRDMLSSYSQEVTNFKSETLQKLDSGRLNYSGQALSSNIISPEFKNEERTVLRNDHYMSDDLIKVEDGKKKYYDTAFISEDYMKDVGVDFKKVGEDVQKMDKDFFDKTVKELDLDIDKNTDMALEMIGKKYASDVGIDAQVFRYPTMLDTSHRASKIKLDSSLSGRTMSLPSWMAATLNDDSDGDKLAFIFNMDEEGHMRGKNDKITIAHNKIRESQAIENADVIDDVVEGYNSNAFANDTDEFLKNVAERTDVSISELDKTSNKSRDIMKWKTTVNSKTAKKQIGQISNPNFKLRESMQNIKNKSKQDIADRNLLIRNFTNLTEQKLIDTKHEKVISENIAKKYSSAMNLMSSDDVKKRGQGYEKMRGILKSNIHVDDDADKADEVINVLKRTFEDKDVRKKYNEIDLNNGLDIEDYAASQKEAITPKELRTNKHTNSYNNPQRITGTVDDVAKKKDVLLQEGNIISVGDDLGKEMYEVQGIDKKNYKIDILDQDGNVTTIKNPNSFPAQIENGYDSLDHAYQSNLNRKTDDVISNSIRDLNNETKKTRAVNKNRAAFHSKVSKLSDVDNTVAKRKAIFNDVLKSNYEQYDSMSDKAFNRVFEANDQASASTKQAYINAQEEFFGNTEKVKAYDDFSVKLRGYNDLSQTSNTGVESKEILRRFNEQLRSTDDVKGIRGFGDDMLVKQYADKTGSYVRNNTAFINTIENRGLKKIGEDITASKAIKSKILDSSKTAQAISEESQKLSKAAKNINFDAFKNMSLGGKVGIGAAAALGAGYLLNNISDNSPSNNRRSMPYQSKGNGFKILNNSIIPSSSYKNISDGKPKGNISVRAKSKTDDNLRMSQLKGIFDKATQSNLNVELNDNQNEVKDNWVKDKFIELLD